MGLITGTRRGKAGRSKSMARRPRGHEKIKMDKKRHGYFPQRFTWRGRRYDVQAVERCWTVSRKRLGNRVERLCFRVRCVAVRGQNGRSSRAIQEGTVVLYQDLNGDSWHLEKVISRT
jgi:hypothetical protein